MTKDDTSEARILSVEQLKFISDTAYRAGAAAERERNTKLLIQMHDRAAAHHSYYKHAAIEINRKADEAVNGGQS